MHPCWFFPLVSSVAAPLQHIFFLVSTHGQNCSQGPGGHIFYNLKKLCDNCHNGVYDYRKKKGISYGKQLPPAPPPPPPVNEGIKKKDLGFIIQLSKKLYVVFLQCMRTSKDSTKYRVSRPISSKLQPIQKKFHSVSSEFEWPPRLRFKKLNNSFNLILLGCNFMIFSHKSVKSAFKIEMHLKCIQIHTSS